MIAVLFISFVAGIIFTVAFISPQSGDEIKRFVTHYGNTIQDWLDGVPAYLRKMSQGSVTFMQKALHLSAEGGKRGREKAPF